MCLDKIQNVYHVKHFRFDITYLPNKINSSFSLVASKSYSLVVGLMYLLQREQKKKKKKTKLRYTL